MAQLTYKQFEKRFSKGFVRLMKRLDFQEIVSDNCYAVQKEKELDRRVKVTISSFAGRLHADAQLIVRLNKVEEWWEDYIGEMGLMAERGFYATYIISLQQAWPGIEERTDYDPDSRRMNLQPDVEGAEKFNALFESVIKEKLLPLGRHYEDIRELDRLINADPVNQVIGIAVGKEWLLRRLIIGRMAGNPRLDAIFQRDLAELRQQEATGEAFYRNYPAVLEKVYNKLKDVGPRV